MANKSRMAYVSLLQGGDWVFAEETLRTLLRALGLDPVFTRHRITRHIREPKIYIAAEGVALPDRIPETVLANARRAGFRLRPPYSPEEVGTQCWECSGMDGRGKKVAFVIRLFPSVAVSVPVP